MTPRRLTFQLTPLLDLLLIVIFAQFLEMRDTTRAQAETSTEQITAASTELESTKASLQQLQQQEQKLRDELVQLNELLTAAREAASSSELQKQEFEDALTQMRRQRDSIADVLAEAFNVPDEVSQELLRARTAEDVRITPEDVKRLREEFRKLGQQQPGDAVRHLLTFEEMRKRCDIWQVYVTATGSTIFAAGNHTHRFRADSAETFSGELYDAYKTLPQPKSLVILLLSYGDVKASTYQAAVEGLPLAAGRMREDQNGRARFEYAVLGYNPTPVGLPVPVETETVP